MLKNFTSARVRYVIDIHASNRANMRVALRTLATFNTRSNRTVLIVFMPCILPFFAATSASKSNGIRDNTSTANLKQ